ncbi:MAG: hypothetical protein GQ474_00475 [Sulfurimonas sp.]|nr:hypothetical protein [Sulfurimonas sp.]
MASSTLFELVNIVLRTTGDLDELTDNTLGTTVALAPSGIGKRIVDMLNLTIGKIERESNWAQLRENSVGTTDGVNDTYEISTVNDVKQGAPVAVWITDSGRLEEVTAEQFDKLRADGGSAAGIPQYFQRGVSATGNMSVQLYPMPATGYTVNVSGYRKATKFSQPPVDTETTDFNDDLLTTGALMHLDVYDGQPRGYDGLFIDLLASAKLEAISNRQVHIEVERY